MSQFQSVIREVEAALQGGTPGRRTQVLDKVTSLFLSGGKRLSEEQVTLFDDVMGHLISCIEHHALAELSRHLAPVPHAPHNVIRALASNDSLDVAGPVLDASERLSDDDLIEIARTKGQGHQLRIAGRAHLNEDVTNVLVDQCDPEVAIKVVSNKGARFSKAGFAKLAMITDGDSRLAAAIAGRPDIPPHIFRAILAQAADTVRQGLMNSASSEDADKLNRILSEISHQIDQKATTERYAPAQALVSSFIQDTPATRLNLVRFAKDGKVEETAATLSALTAVPIELVDRLMNDANRYGIMVLCKMMGMQWSLAQNVIRIGRNPDDTIQSDMDELFEDYEALAVSLANRLLRFWQAQQLRQNQSVA